MLGILLDAYMMFGEINKYEIMRKSTIILLIIIAFISCKRDDINNIDINDNELIVNVNLTNNILVQSKANVPVSSGDISSLYLLVFNENGAFISLHKGDLTNSTNLGS